MVSTGPVYRAHGPEPKRPAPGLPSYTPGVSPGRRQPSTAQLRWGLHALVVTLALSVLLRALLLDEDAAWSVAAAVVLFVAMYAARVAASAPAVRAALLAGLVAAWAGLVLLDADAAYVSVGLFLVFLTDLSVRRALAGVAGMTAFDVTVASLRGDSLALVLAPVLGAAISVLFGLGYRLLFDAVARQQGLIDELRRTRAELAASEHAAGQAAERQRLAREIHDTVAQSLSSIQMLLHAADADGLPAQARTRVGVARETAAAALAETRRILAELMPADLADSTLTAALHRVCGRAVRPVQLVVDGEPRPVPPEVEAALVRIAQGAVANVDRHAGPAARAVMSLSWSGDRVRLDVVDDGVGFDATASAGAERRRFGLATIRARVAELGGEFELESEPGHTALSTSFPLAASVPA